MDRAVAIKNSLGRSDFRSEHTAGVANLPDHHKDPFNRILIAQATVEGITLLTNDQKMAAYIASPIRLLG